MSPGGLCPRPNPRVCRARTIGQAERPRGWTCALRTKTLRSGARTIKCRARVARPVRRRLSTPSYPAIVAAPTINDSSRGDAPGLRRRKTNRRTRRQSVALDRAFHQAGFVFPRDSSSISNSFHQQLVVSFGAGSSLYGSSDGIVLWPGVTLRIERTVPRGAQLTWQRVRKLFTTAVIRRDSSVSIYYNRSTVPVPDGSIRTNKFYTAILNSRSEGRTVDSHNRYITGGWGSVTPTGSPRSVRRTHKYGRSGN